MITNQETVSTTQEKGRIAEGVGLFTRQSSGLVREIGIVAATAMTLAAVGLPLTFVNFNAGLTSFSGVDFYVPLLGAAFIWFIAMFAYRYLVTAVPRAGGEYVFLSRIVSPAAGSVVGVGICVYFTFIVASNGHFVASFAPFMLAGLGAAFKSHAIANAANHVTSNGAIAAISCGCLIVVGLLSVFSLKRLAQIILGLIGLQVLTMLVLALLLADHSHSQFVAAFGHYSGRANAYSAVISAAKSSGVPFGISAAAIFATIPFMTLNYAGVLGSYYVGGELRRPARTYLHASAIALGLLLAAWVGVWALMRHTIGLDFMQAQSNLAPATYAKISSLDSSVNGLGYGLVLSGDPITKILLATALPVTAFTFSIFGVVITTRVLFALAFDRVLPVGVARVSQRNHTPTVAIMIVLMVSLAFCVILAFVDIANIVALLSLFTSLILLSGGIAASFLAYRRPELVKRAGATDVDRWAGVPKITWIGLATAALALFVMIEVITHQNVYGKFSVESVTCLAVVLLAGPVTYLVARQVRKQRDALDLDMTMHELPPE